MRVIYTKDPSFEETFRLIHQRGKVFDPELWRQVGTVVDDVAQRGDAALFEYTAQFDNHVVNEENIEISPSELDAAAAKLGQEDRAVLELSADRIRKFHERQVMEDWVLRDAEGIELESRVLPLDRVAVYAPGGRNPYPSTVLMAVIPARIAGVKEIILASPTKGQGVHPLIAAAAKISGADRVLGIGGAQAVAALAYGTQSVPRVDKIVGPGNAYVTAAKKMVYGQCGIDMIAGPSEVLIIADGTGHPAHAAADLLSQAEHDDMASAVLVTPDEDFGRKVADEVDRQLGELSRKEVAESALESFGAVMIAVDMDEAVEIANRFAPEHLELMVGNPREIVKDIRHAGAVFLGHHTPETLGDYLAGANHVLPTGGTARFASPLGVYDFVKRMSVISFTEKALGRYGRHAARFAAMEGLDAHEKAVTIRLK
ncbi:MAG: histidinol dehydrogenase [Syntrophales bacterium]|jgi:histidinol dehydrogenase|nr:histidinol dehydrogenase [Syntrophales bacterium]